MGEDPPARGACAGIFPGSARERSRTQEEACVATRLYGQIEAADFLECWVVASCDHGQCAFWSAQHVFCDSEQAGRVRFNADQMVQWNTGLMQPAGVQFGRCVADPEDRPPALFQDGQQHGETGSDLQGIGDQKVMQAAGPEAAAEMGIDGRVPCGECVTMGMGQISTLQASDLLAQSRHGVRCHLCSP